MRLTPLAALEDNYVWMLQNGSDALIVDPGDAAVVSSSLVAQSLTPKAILITHHHADHCAGVTALQRNWPSVRVFAPDDPRLDFAFEAVDENMTIDIDAWHFEVLATPGHTSTHIAFIGHDLLFCGDTLFSLGCGRILEGTHAQMWASLQKLAQLPTQTKVCCAHEYTLSNAAFAAQVDPDNRALRQRIEHVREQRTSGQPSLPIALASELECNPFLRCDVETIQTAVASRLGHTPDDALETFAELRRWKDGFRA